LLFTTSQFPPLSVLTAIFTVVLPLLATLTVMALGGDCWPAITAANGARRDAEMSMPLTVKLTVRVTVDPPADIVTVPVYGVWLACNPVGLAAMVIVTHEGTLHEENDPPAVMVLLFTDAESHGALLLIEMVMLAEPLPVAIRRLFELVTCLVVPAFAETSTPL
jgi:hypothetical protein